MSGTGRSYPPYLFTALIISFLPSFTTAAVAVTVVPPAAGISYSQHCKATVPEPSLLPDPNPPLKHTTISLRHAYVDYRGNNTKGIPEIPRSLTFFARGAYRTQNDAIFKIEAVLDLFAAGRLDYLRGNSARRGLRLVHYRPPRIPVSSGAARFILNGFWDWRSRKLCMIGSGSGQLRSDHGVLKLDYLNSSSIFDSFVNGTFEILNVNDNGFNHNLLWILGVNLRKYRYELINKEIANRGFDSLDDTTDVSLGVEDLGRQLCLFIRTSGPLELKYEAGCETVNCKFLGRGNNNSLPSMMSFNEIECLNDGRVRFLLDFRDIGHNGQQLPFEPSVSLVSEGKWDAKKRRLDMVGCRIFSDWYKDFVGECLIRLSLRFPARWTLEERSSVVGIMWSSRSSNESGYFGRVALISKRNKNDMAIGLKYEYAEIENAKRSCANKTMPDGERGDFPDGLSSDLRFDMVVGNPKVKDLWGYSSPLYVEERLYQVSAFDWELKSIKQMKQNFTGVLNVSYVLSLSAPYDFKLSSEYTQIKSFEISAEGLYDTKNGHLCMVGCMHVESSHAKLQHNSSLDCKILVNIQYPSLLSKDGASAKGTIESMREKSHHLYFEPLEIFSRSVYSGQAKESIWRMDLEISMVLVSNTLSCLFVCLQLLHVKRHAEMLPFLSTMMLVMLTLAHMVPLLLNFEALFLVKPNIMDSYFHSDGLLEVNEVLVRVITMIVFLLEFRLVQLAWSAKSRNEIQKNLWISEKKVVYASLPIYIGGGLIVWFIHVSKQSYSKPSFRIHQLGHKSFWGDLKAYGGLILDGFLLPQILFNLFCDAKEKALAPCFYVGITFVRLIPHAYDLYRSYSSVWSLNFIYANPRMDHYSPVWDIMISVGGASFVFLIYLQQRYGGGCFLPKRWWWTSTYDKLPVASAEQYIATSLDKCIDVS